MSYEVKYKGIVIKTFSALEPAQQYADKANSEYLTNPYKVVFNPTFKVVNKMRKNPSAKSVLFTSLAIGDEFIQGGTHFIKKSSRTALMNQAGYPKKSFYMEKHDIVQPVTRASNPTPKRKAPAKRKVNIDLEIAAAKKRVAPVKRNPAPKKSYIALKIQADNDRNGNPRKGYLIWFNDGKLIDFLDEGYRGDSVLEKYTQTHNLVLLGTLGVTPAIYAQAKKSI